MITPVEPQGLFATPLWTIRELPRIQAALPRIVAAVEADVAAGVIGSKHNRSNALGVQSKRVPLAQSPYLGAAERQELLAAFAWTARLAPGFRITTWVNCNWGQSLNRAHVHPGAELSGVLYVQVPEGAGALVFHDPRPQAEMSLLGRRLIRPVAGLCSRHVVQPEAGSLLLFPSWLLHGVEQGSNHHQLRIAISFDVAGLVGLPLQRAASS